MIISLRIKILAIVLVFLALLGAFFLFYSLATTVNLKQLRLESIEHLVEHESEKINKAIKEIERGALFFVQGARIIYDAQLSELGELFVYEYLKSFQIAVGAGFWYEPYAYSQDQFRAGFYAFYDKNIGDVRIDDTFFLDEYDYHRMNWYQEISKGISKPHQIVWTVPYVDDSGSLSLMTTAGSGVFNDEGRLLAISTVDWEISDIVRQLLEIRPTPNSYMVLCVPYRDYIISSTYIYSAAGASLSDLPWDIFSDSFSHNGTNYISFGRYLDNLWYLSIQIPENEILADVEKRNERYSIIIALSSFLLLFFAYLLITEFINKPLKKLTAQVALIEPGNLDRQINISSRDELGQLALTFNKMTGELKNSIEANAREREEKKRISTELAVANEIQASMLPNVFPPFPDRKEFDLYASMIPARDVGGDFYDFFFVDKDNLAVVIADVSGKGVPAALFMVVSKTLIKNACSNGSLDEVLEAVNKKLCEGNETGMFVTVFMGIFNIPERKFSFVNAGHNPPLIRRKCGSWEFLRTKPCAVLAFLEDTEYRREEISLDSGDMIYFYTDGVTEAMNGGKELFGEDRLTESLGKCHTDNTQDILHFVKREIDNFTDGAEQADDITMLALKINDVSSGVTVEADIKNLDILMAYINKELDKYKYSSEYKNETGIACEEIFLNISNYAYTPEKGNVNVTITTLCPQSGKPACKNSALKNLKTVIKFEDTGVSYNPLSSKDPDLNEDLKVREPGGLGIFLVKKIMDTIEYSRKDGKNILTITRNHP